MNQKKIYSLPAAAIELSITQDQLRCKLHKMGMRSMDLKPNRTRPKGSIACFLSNIQVERIRVSLAKNVNRRKKVANE